MQVKFFFEQKNISLSERTRLKKFIVNIFRAERRPLLHLNYIFCSDKYLLKINQDYLGHDYYTDIITFNLSEPGKPVEGDIYISIDRVRDNASQQGTSIHMEIHRVAFHGALHLCGYSDKKKKEKDIMRNMEDYYLDGYFKKRST